MSRLPRRAKTAEEIKIIAEIRQNKRLYAWMSSKEHDNVDLEMAAKLLREDVQHLVANSEIISEETGMPLREEPQNFDNLFDDIDDTGNTKENASNLSSWTFKPFLFAEYTIRYVLEYRSNKNGIDDTIEGAPDNIDIAKDRYAFFVSMCVSPKDAIEGINALKDLHDGYWRDHYTPKQARLLFRRHCVGLIISTIWFKIEQRIKDVAKWPIAKFWS